MLCSIRNTPCVSSFVKPLCYVPRELGGKVLVHCKMGISRSASVVIAYAMKAYHLTLAEASQLVKTKRSCIKPNNAFALQLKTYQVG